MIATKNKQILDIALIGCGYISQTHLQAIEQIPSLRLVAAVDVNKSAAENVANKYRCSAYSEYREMLENNQIDAVVICTPPNKHSEIATFFLKNAVHVFCEKPLAINTTEASSMLKEAEKGDLLLMMASKFRYVNDVTMAKDIIASGKIGEIVLFENVFCSKADMQGRWFVEKNISGGGVLIDNGSHSVDIIRYLFGPISQVQAEEGKRVQDIKVEDTARVYLRTKSGLLGTVDLSWSIQKERKSYIDVYGTKGVLSVCWQGSGYKLEGNPEWIPFGTGYNKLSAFESQLNNF